ncbi:MAG: putative lipopolysaccharide heptosyltransferase III [Betaproteobacteria bacterium]|nr:MAG: putative lipopolysaccharide heptosyltransferase III [Betaproteobacteria bacterium]
MPPAPSDPVPLAQVSRVLVTKLRHHGDVLLASPVLSVLKRAAPAAEIDALVYRETAPLLERHPALSRLFTIDRGLRTAGALARLRAEIALLRALRARGHDLLVHLTEHPRGLVLALLARPRYAVTRVAAKHRWAWRLGFTHFYPWPKGTSRHTVETNLDALRRIGIVPRDEDKRLIVVPSAADEARVEAELARRGLAHGGFAQMHPGSRWLFKAWESDRMAEVAHVLAGRGLPVVLTGAPDARERAIVDDVLAALPAASRPAVHDLVGTLSLPELAALAARARVFVGVDSAPMHVAAAAGTPVVALFGPSDEREWGPWKVAHRVVASTEHPCRPCRNDGCGGGKRSECLATLPAARVLAAIDDVLAPRTP